MERLWTFLYTIWVYLVFTTFMLILLPFMLLPVILNRRWSWMTLKVITVWAFIFSKLTLVRYKILDKDIQEEGKAYVFVCNHNSFLDAPALPLAIRGEFKALGKKELLDIPVFGWILQSVAVLVDRSDTESRKASIERMNKVFQRNISVVIFPEGTTNKTDYPLTPFYDGAFRIAIENQAPILPIVISNSKALMPRNGFRNKPGTILVRLLQPMETKGMAMEDLQYLKQEVFNLMEEAILSTN